MFGFCFHELNQVAATYIQISARLSPFQEAQEWWMNFQHDADSIDRIFKV